MENSFSAIVQQKSDEELLQMVYQFDTWDIKMLNAVEDELAKRNLLPADVQVRKQELVQQEDEMLSKGKPGSIGGQIFGWIFVLGIFGIIIGYSYKNSKTRSKYTGKKYFTYDEDTRDNGTYMFYISLSVLIVAVLYRLLKMYN